MVRIVLFLGLLFSPLAFGSEILFEGYYRLELESKPIGYVIQRYETDSKNKIIRSAYFLKTNELGGNIQESLKAEAKIKEGGGQGEIEPVSYQYTGQTGKELKSIDATFKGTTMQILKTDAQKTVKSTYRIPPKTFLATFLGYYLLQGGMKVGTHLDYSAVAEEEGLSYKGVTDVKDEEVFAGQKAYRIENKFKTDTFVSFVTPQGDMLGTVSPEKKIRLVLVAKPAEATEGFPVPNKSLVLTFGNIPTGKANVLARNASGSPAPKTPPSEE